MSLQSELSAAANKTLDILDFTAVIMKAFPVLQTSNKSIRSSIFSAYITAPDSLDEIRVENLSKNIKFCHTVEKLAGNDTAYACQYSKISEGTSWSSLNCRKENEYRSVSDETGLVLCGCNHLTEFAVVESFNIAVDQTNAGLLLRSDNLGSVDYFKTEGRGRLMSLYIHRGD